MLWHVKYPNAIAYWVTYFRAFSNRFQSLILYPHNLCFFTIFMARTLAAWLSKTLLAKGQRTFGQFWPLPINVRNVHGPVIFSPPTKGGQSGRGMVDPKGRASWLQSHDKVDTLCVWPETTALGQKMQKSHAGKCRKFTCEHSKFWFCLKSWSDSEIKNTEYFNHNQKYLMWPHFIFPLNVLTQPSLNKSRLYILFYPYPIQNRSQPTCTFDVIFFGQKINYFFLVHAAYTQYLLLT